MKELKQGNSVFTHALCFFYFQSVLTLHMHVHIVHIVHARSVTHVVVFLSSHVHLAHFMLY